MKELNKGSATIRNFNTLPEASLEMLKQKLGLRMSQAELTFCAKNYNQKGGIDVDELCFIDAVACPKVTDLSKVAIGELLTNEPYVAETYEDMLQKMQAMGRSAERPVTVRDVLDAPTRYLRTLAPGKSVSAVGSSNSGSAYAAMGHAAQFRLNCKHGSFDVLEKLPLNLQQHAEYADVLMMLCPDDDANMQVYEEAVTKLLRDPEVSKHIHCIADRSRSSIIHSVLAMSSGAVINLAYRPESAEEINMLTVPGPGNILAMPQSAVSMIKQRAEKLGLPLYYVGMIDHAGSLSIRYDKDVFLEISVPYLKSVCFIRSYVMCIDEEVYSNEPASEQNPNTRAVRLSAPAEFLEEDANQTDSVLRTMPPLRTRNAAHGTLGTSPYHQAVRCIIDAYCTAIAAGCKPGTVSLHNRLAIDNRVATYEGMSQALAALLGIYRFSMETAAHVTSDVSLEGKDSDVLTLASAPADLVIPNVLQGSGKIYLLQPKYDEYGLPVWEDFVRMIDYLRNQMLRGNVKAARAVCGKMPLQVLADMSDGSCGVVHNPAYEGQISYHCPGAFILEVDAFIDGDLIAATMPAKREDE